MQQKNDRRRLAHGRPHDAAKPVETTALVLIVFAGLTIMGITDSARISLVIFILHLATLTLLILWCVLLLPQMPRLWIENWNLTCQDGHWSKALFLGFSTVMLGVSGFESSANYVEQQRPGVFRLTLRNRWLAVTIFNPLIALLALAVLTVPKLAVAKDDLLARPGMVVGSHPFHNLIVIDAFLVLSGGVLTSYVAVGGLVHRMTLDQCFLQFLLRTTSRDGYLLIIVAFIHFACPSFT